MAAGRCRSGLTAALEVIWRCLPQKVSSVVLPTLPPVVHQRSPSRPAVKLFSEQIRELSGQRDLNRIGTQTPP